MTHITARLASLPQDHSALSRVLAESEALEIGEAELGVDRLLPQCTGSLVAFAPGGQLVGGLFMRQSPQHGFELIGGLMPESDREAGTVALCTAAQQHALDTGQPETYLFASDRAWDSPTLERLGYQEIGAYQLWMGEVNPENAPPLPAGYTLSGYAERPDFEGLIVATRFYESLHGHQLVTTQGMRALLDTTDTSLLFLLRDASDQVAGTISARLEEDQAVIDAPSLRPDLEQTNLRAAQIGCVAALVRPRSLADIKIEGWGESQETSAALQRMGLREIERIPILARLVSPVAHGTK